MPMLPGHHVLEGIIAEPGHTPVRLEPFDFGYRIGIARRYFALWRRDGRVHARVVMEKNCDEERDWDCGDIGFNGWLLIWDTSTGRLLRRAHAGSSLGFLSSFRFVGDRYVLAAHAEERDMLFDYETWYGVRDWTMCDGTDMAGVRVDDASFDDAGRRAVAKREDFVVLVDIEHRRCIRARWARGKEKDAISTALAPDGRTVAVATMSGHVILLDWDTKQPIRRRWRGPQAKDFAAPANNQPMLRFSPDGRSLYYLTENGLDILNRRTGKWIRLIPLLEPGGKGSMLAVDDEGLVDGDDSALDQVTFRLGDQYWQGLSAVEAAAVRSPRVKGLLAKILGSGGGGGDSP